MDRNELVKRVESEQQRVTEMVNSLLKVQPQAPKISIVRDITSVVKELEPMRRLKVSISGCYNLEQIYLSPDAVLKIAEYLKTKGVRINPAWEMIRVLAKEYGMHAYSAIQKFSSESMKNLPNTGEDNLDWISGHAVMEAVGFMVKLEIGRKFGHRDSYMAAHRHNLKYVGGRLKTVNESTAEAGLVSLQAVIGASLGYELAEKGEAAIREFAHLPFKDALEFARGHFQHYAANPPTQAF